MGLIATHVFPWRSGGQLWLTLAAKVTFAFDAAGVVEVVEAEPVVAAEVHHRKSAACSIRQASDVAPRRDRCDVSLVGHAHAPRGAPVERMRVRLALFRGDVALLDKSLAIVGDRIAGAGAPPKRFTRMPIVYERAHGGPGDRENPLGVTELENVALAGAGASPAGFAPLSAFWPARKRHAHVPARTLSTPMPDVFGFEPAYFQTAPEDQRVPFLQGDETFVLEGLVAGPASVRVTLPRVVLRAEVYVSTARSPIALVCDALVLDADLQRASLVFRGVVPMSDARDAARASFDVRFELEGAAIARELVGARDRPSDREGAAEQKAEEPRAMGDTVMLVADDAPPKPALDRTSVLSDGDHDRVRGATPTPFAAGPTLERAAARPIPGAPWSPDAAPRAPAAHGLDATFVIDDAAGRAAALARLAPPQPPVIKAPREAEAPATGQAPSEFAIAEPLAPPAPPSVPRVVPRREEKHASAQAKTALREVYARLRGSQK